MKLIFRPTIFVVNQAYQMQSLFDNFILEFVNSSFQAKIPILSGDDLFPLSYYRLLDLNNTFVGIGLNFFLKKGDIFFFLNCKLLRDFLSTEFIFVIFVAPNRWSHSIETSHRDEVT